MKGPYASLYKLQPDHHRKASFLQQMRQFLQHQAVLPVACKSAGRPDLRRVWLKGFEHTAAQSITLCPLLYFPAWPRSCISIFRCCRNLSRFLHPQTLYQSQWSSAADVPWVPARSSTACLDDAAKGTAEIAGWDWKAGLQAEKQGWVK